MRLFSGGRPSCVSCAEATSLYGAAVNEAKRELCAVYASGSDAEKVLDALRAACSEESTRKILREIFNGDELREGLVPGYDALRWALEPERSVLLVVPGMKPAMPTSRKTVPTAAAAPCSGVMVRTCESILISDSSHSPRESRS